MQVKNLRTYCVRDPSDDKQWICGCNSEPFCNAGDFTLQRTFGGGDAGDSVKNGAGGAEDRTGTASGAVAVAVAVLVVQLHVC